MKLPAWKKYALVGGLPLAALLAAGPAVASAHGWMAYGASPDEVAQRQVQVFQEQANLLGLSVDQVKNAWAQGKTLRELASENGISDVQLKQKFTELHRQRMAEHLKVLVEKGVITQQQADQRLQAVGQRPVGMRAGFRHGWFR